MNDAVQGIALGELTTEELKVFWNMTHDK